MLHAINYVNFKKEDMTCASATSTELTSELMGRTQAKSISSQIKNPIQSTINLLIVESTPFSCNGVLQQYYCVNPVQNDRTIFAKQVRGKASSSWAIFLVHHLLQSSLSTNQRQTTCRSVSRTTRSRKTPA